MTTNWLGGVVPPLDAPRESDTALQALATSTVAVYGKEIEALEFSRAFETLWTLIRAGNKYIDSEEPWALNKKGDRERLAGVMRRTLEVCRIAALLLEPVMPTKMKELQQKVGAEARWTEELGMLAGLREGSRVATGEPLFPRMMELPARIQEALHMAESAERAEGTPATATPSTPKEDAPAAIAIDDFQRIQLRSGRVLAAEKHPKADKLLVLKVDLGEPTPRQIVAGIATKYAPEELVGRTVVVVANLKPAKLRGVESQGMLLAAGGQEVVGLVSLPDGVAPGTIVR
jgi:methionyl-tRNA synthetase